MTNPEKIILLKKWLILLCLAFCLSIAQCSVGFMAIFNIKPVWLLPFSLGCSKFLNPKESAILGGLSGCLWDCFSEKAFGYSSFILIIGCVFTSLFCSYIVHSNLANAIILTTGFFILYNFIDFLFRYLIWDVEFAWSIWIYHIFPTMIYTIIITPFMYILSKRICNKFHKNIENDS